MNHNITVKLNGEAKTIEANSQLSDAIDRWQLDGNSFAVAINQHFIPKACYEETQLTEGDSIELVIPMQGG